MKNVFKLVKINCCFVYLENDCITICAYYNSLFGLKNDVNILAKKKTSILFSEI